MPSHHPGLELLMDYATGSLSEAVALVIATHLALCPNCRRQVRDFETIGGLLLEREGMMPVSETCRRAVMARLDEQVPPPSGMPPTPPRCVPRRMVESVILPQPLRGYVGAEPADLAWKTVMRGMHEHEIDVGPGPVRARLFRLNPGVAVPRHTHDGVELALVLDGTFEDGPHLYRRGDIALSDGTVDHSPMADPCHGCLCLMVTDAPLRLTGTLTRLLNPFIRI